MSELQIGDHVPTGKYIFSDLYLNIHVMQL